MPEMLVQGWSHRMNKQFCPYVLAFTPVSIVPSLVGGNGKFTRPKLHLVENIFWSNPGVQKDKSSHRGEA
jgi:hypothetical protein